jgi:hypothetical protein
MFMVAATKLSDVLRPKSHGEPVNVHVVQPLVEPQPDFGAMQRVIQGDEQSQSIAEPIRESES